MTTGQSGRDGRQGLIVAVPVLFVDEWMPLLKDTELRVLLAVLRQTQVLGRETPTTWLTHRELRRRTGRASEAVTAAIANLVRLGLLETLDEGGRMLVSPAERQGAPGRRLYRVTNLASSLRSTMAGKAKTIEGNHSIYRFRKSDASTLLPNSPIGVSVSPEHRQRIEREKTKIRERLRGIGALPPKPG